MHIYAIQMPSGVFCTLRLEKHCYEPLLFALRGNPLSSPWFLWNTPGLTGSWLPHALTSHIPWMLVLYYVFQLIPLAPVWCGPKWRNQSHSSHTSFLCVKQIMINGGYMAKIEITNIYPITQLISFLLPPASSHLFSLCPFSPPKSLCISDTLWFSYFPCGFVSC